jgi:MFS family permease
VAGRVDGVLTPYRQLAAVPHLARVIGWSLFGRLHMTTIGISLTFLVADWTGSYGRAGLVVGAAVLGWGVGGPLRGRGADRGNAVRQLVVTSTLYAAGIAVLAVLPASAWTVAPLIAFVTGTMVPATGPVGRAVYSRMADGPTLRAAYTVEATLQEVLFVLGPAAAAFVVAFAGPRFAMGMVSVLALVGGIGFALMLRRTGLGGGPRPRPEGAAGGRLLAIPGLAPAIGASMLFVAAYTTVDLAIVAWTRERGTPALAGVLVAVWAGGSLAGGLVSGGLPGLRAPRLWLRTLAVAAGMVALTATLPPLNGLDSALLVGAVLFAGGTATSPTAATSNAIVGGLAPDHRRAEAFGWTATSRTIGGAVAAPAAGFLMDSTGPAAATAAAVALALGSAGLASLIRTPAAGDLAAVGDDRIP